MKILILDVGTSSMRGVLMNDRAETLCCEQIKYGPTYLADGRVEEDPADWLHAARRLCASESGRMADAVAITSQRSSVIPVDRAGQPLCGAIMWQDTRNREICEGLSRHSERIRQICGAAVNTVFSGGKMAWLKQCMPEIYERADGLFVIPEYLLYHMTGARRLDYTYGSRSLLMDLRTCRWSEELLALFGIERGKLSELTPPGSAAGYISEAFAAATGLRQGIPVIACGGDQQCGAVGQGAVRPGTVSVNLGTGAYLIAETDRFMPEAAGGLLYNASAVPGEYILESSVLTCGAALDWFSREFGAGADTPALVREAMVRTEPGAGGVVALPYFQGRSDPDWNSRARAVFCGMSLTTSRLDLFRSVLESICCEIRRSVRAMERIQPIQSICLGGGLSASREVCQLTADVTGKEVRVLDSREATVRGAWMSAAVWAGLVRDWEQAFMAASGGEPERFLPRTELTGLYEQIAGRIDALYGALEPLF